MLLRHVKPEEATGKTAEIYTAMNNAMGMIPNAFKMYSVSEGLLAKQYEGLVYFMSQNALSGKLLAFIRLLVSFEERCEYCISINTGILMQYGVLPEQITGIRANPETAPLPANELALLLFVLKAVKTPEEIRAETIDNLRLSGWDDKQIFEATFHGSMQVASDKMLIAFNVEAD